MVNLTRTFGCYTFAYQFDAAHRSAIRYNTNVGNDNCFRERQQHKHETELLQRKIDIMFINPPDGLQAFVQMKSSHKKDLFTGSNKVQRVDSEAGLRVGWSHSPVHGVPHWSHSMHRLAWTAKGCVSFSAGHASVCCVRHSSPKSWCGQLIYFAVIGQHPRTFALSIALKKRAQNKFFFQRIASLGAFCMKKLIFSAPVGRGNLRSQGGFAVLFSLETKCCVSLCLCGEQALHSLVLGVLLMTIVKILVQSFFFFFGIFWKAFWGAWKFIYLFFRLFPWFFSSLDMARIIPFPILGTFLSKLG